MGISDRALRYHLELNPKTDSVQQRNLCDKIKKTRGPVYCLTSGRVMSVYDLHGIILLLFSFTFFFFFFFLYDSYHTTPR